MRLTIVGAHPPVGLVERYQLRSEGAEAYNLLLARDDGDPDLWPRLRDAGRVLASLRPPGFPQVLGEVMTGIGPGIVVSPYLGVLLERMPPRPDPAVAVWLLADIAGALAPLAPHVHRGINAGTLYVSRGRRVGIAGLETIRPQIHGRGIDTCVARPAPGGRVAPEQQDGERFDVPATMTHMLAATLVQLLAGPKRVAHAPLASEQDWHYLLRQTFLPPELEALLGRCLKDDPEARILPSDLAWCASELLAHLTPEALRRVDNWLEHAQPATPDRAGAVHGEVVEPIALDPVEPPRRPRASTPRAPTPEPTDTRAFIAAARGAPEPTDTRAFIAAAEGTPEQAASDPGSTRWVRTPIPVRRAPAPARPPPSPASSPFAPWSVPDDTRQARAVERGRARGELAKGAILGLALAILFLGLARLLG